VSTRSPPHAETVAETPAAATDPRGVYRHHVIVGWGDCDPAGIVYFPRFFEMFHGAMEQWFGDALGQPYEVLIMGRKLGLPSVHTEADFRAPCRFGERLVVELRVPKLGRTSIELQYRVLARRGDALEAEPRLTGRTVCALMDLDPQRPSKGRAVAWPSDLRARIETFGVAVDDPANP